MFQLKCIYFDMCILKTFIYKGVVTNFLVSPPFIIIIMYKFLKDAWRLDYKTIIRSAT